MEENVALEPRAGMLPPRAILYGVAAALIGSGAWYAVVVVTDYKLGLVAVAVGWLVGKGVLLGAGNRGSRALQFVGGLLAFAALFLGEYLIVNHFARQAVEDFNGWLTLEQFFSVYPQILAEGNWVLDIAFYLFALYEGVVLPRPRPLPAPA